MEAETNGGAPERNGEWNGRSWRFSTKFIGGEAVFDYVGPQLSEKATENKTKDPLFRNVAQIYWPLVENEATGMVRNKSSWQCGSRIG
ncbi:hypothetical protein V6N13_095032 [Hibiscus sabdariffa]|uniref:Uncharacterized protein n=1 Tax=Hibiscus sabdariffa TaxID=183260 RepID=A0ABR2PSZ6_9ROSI